MKSKKIQLAALGILLAAVIAVGAWLVLRTPGEDTPAVSNTSSTPTTSATPSSDSGGVHTNTMSQPFDISSFQTSIYRPVRQASDDPSLPIPIGDPLSEIFFFEGQPCVFSFHQGESEEDFSLDVVSMASGETLRTYGPEEFYMRPYFRTPSFDRDGTLWCTYYEWESEQVTVFPCREGVTEDDVFFFSSDTTPSSMAVRDGYFLISDASYGADGRLLMLDTSSGTAEVKNTWENIASFCFGEDGSLYLLARKPDGLDYDRALVKYSLQKDAEQWNVSLTEDDFSYPYSYPSSVSYTNGGGLFLLYGAEKKLLWIDPETGEAQLLVDLENDVTGLDSGWIGGDRSLAVCVVDGQNRLYFNCLSFDFSDRENPVFGRDLYVLEPDPVEADPADAVTLTITAPYKVESVAAAARAYLRDHPNVELVWDTQFLSREELQKNSMEYKDQIALRVMTGDVGDIVMVTGSGLGTEAMTETDAFADLSDYLSACPFREELPDNLIDPLRGEDGSIRGLPLGVLPTYYVWNQELLDELNIDPYTVTWSELLDLALSWKEQGTDLSLEIKEAGIGMYGSEEQIFEDILLANLYDLPQTDGSVRLDQPYLRGLLEKFKALSGSSQMVRSDGQAAKALIVGAYGGNGYLSDRVYRIQMASDDHGIPLRAAPLPFGEVSQKRQGYAFCWAVSQRSENREAAWDFLQYLASSKAMTLDSGYTYTIDTLPANTAAQERWVEYHNSQQWKGWDLEQQMKTYFQQIQEAMKVPYVRFDEITGWYPAVGEPLAEYLVGGLTLDEAMEQADSNWARFLME